MESFDIETGVGRARRDALVKAALNQHFYRALPSVEQINLGKGHFTHRDTLHEPGYTPPRDRRRAHILREVKVGPYEFSLHATKGWRRKKVD